MKILLVSIRDWRTEKKIFILYFCNELIGVSKYNLNKIVSCPAFLIASLMSLSRSLCLRSFFSSSDPSWDKLSTLISYRIISPSLFLSLELRSSPIAIAYSMLLSIPSSTSKSTHRLRRGTGSYNN